MAGEVVKKIIISVIALGAMGASIFWAVNKVNKSNTAPANISSPIRRAQAFRKGKTIFDDPKFQALKNNSIKLKPIEKIKTGNKNPFLLPEKEKPKKEKNE